MSDSRYAASMDAIWTLWPTRHESGINRSILRHALRYARAWRKRADADVETSRERVTEHRVRGACSGCGYLIPLRKDGNVQKHRLWAGQRRLGPCNGSGKPPRSRASIVYLEGVCGHEFAWPTKDGPAPSDGVCEEHGLTALWAQRLEPRKDENLPRGKLVSKAEYSQAKP